MNFEPISLSAGYPWYGLVNDAALEQGDLLFSFPVLEPTTALLVETDADSDLQVMTHPPLLIESWLPIAAVGAESQG